MSENKEKQEETIEKDHENAEKPITLHGPKFVDVVKALLETKPMPKGDTTKSDEK